MPEYPAPGLTRMIFTTIDPVADLTVHEVVGPVDLEEWLTYARVGLKVSASPRVLWDFTQGIPVGAGPGEIGTVLAQLNSTSPWGPKARIAVLVPPPDMLAPSRVRPEEAAGPGYVGLFTDFTEASLWLAGVSEEPAGSQGASRAA